MLKEIYSLYGVAPKIPGVESQGAQKQRIGPPPKGPSPLGSPYGAPQTMGNVNNSAVPTSYSMRSPQEPLQQFHAANGPPSGPFQMTVGAGQAPMTGPHQMIRGSSLPPLSGPPPFSSGNLPQAAPSVGPPPMAGFVKKS